MSVKALNSDTWQSMPANHLEKNFYLFLIDEISCAFTAKQNKEPLLETTLARASILSGAFALECCANILISEQYGGAFREDIDKLSFLSKFELYARLASHKELDRGRVETQNIEELRKTRNRLVHPQPKNNAMEMFFGKEPYEQSQKPIGIRAKKLLSLRKNAYSLSHEDAFAVLKAVAEFCKYFFVELLNYDASKIQQILTSSILVAEGGKIGIPTQMFLVELGLENWVEICLKEDIQLDFLIATHNPENAT